MATRIWSVKLINQKGKAKRIYEPFFGRIELSNEGGRTMITKKRWLFPDKIIIPSNEDRVEVEHY